MSSVGSVWFRRWNQVVWRDNAVAQYQHEHAHGARDAPVTGLPAAHGTARGNLKQTRQALGAETKGVADAAEFGGGHLEGDGVNEVCVRIVDKASGVVV
ncbi:hypothetical protein LCGC14_3074030, partial [marine sediment metagenome]